MRLRDLDPNAWARIAAELESLCEEVADEEGDGPWPPDGVAVAAYESLSRAATLAAILALSPHAQMSRLVGLLRRVEGPS